ncbi:MAG: hypothetical protein FWE29_01370 [Defluviitaleaceae bacterium]|nr:hypothetical protein [Defluviitaleaceae bacterium]
MENTKEKFGIVFDKLNLSDSLLEIFGKAFVTRIAVSKSSMVMKISLEMPDIVSKAAETSLKETILSEFRSLSAVELEITQDFSAADDIFGSGIDTAEEMALFE